MSIKTFKKPFLLKINPNWPAMARRRVLFVDWHSFNGSAQGKRKLSLRENHNGKFTCPIKTCLHADFESKRGLRKHIDNKHAWYYYFDNQPEIKREEVEQNQPAITKKANTSSKPYYSMEEGIGKIFLQWLCTSCGGGKSEREAKQIAKRALKFLMSSTGENDNDTPLSFELLDCCLGSPSIIIQFLTILETEWKLASSGCLNYVKAISDLMDFRKSRGVSDGNLRCFAVTEVYLRRGKENLRKKKRLDSTRNFDLETLIGKDSWATLEEMENVIPYHIHTFNEIVKRCKSQRPLPNKQEITFCTRFVTTFLFLRVKCSRPMTFQYLTLSMIEKAKTNEGFIDQREFKTAGTYLFDTLILTEDIFTILEAYIDFVRPLTNPTCDYLLVSTNGTQYKSLTSPMTILVYEAIKKYVHPTRYRQIVETTSADLLSREEQELISEDQKHSSNVAKVYYKKKQSRTVAIAGKQCMEKMVGPARDVHQQQLSPIFSELKSFVTNPPAIVTSTPEELFDIGAGPSSQGDSHQSPYSVSVEEENVSPLSSNNIIQRVQNICVTNKSSQSAVNLDISGESDIQMTITSTIPANNETPKNPYNTRQISRSVNIKKEVAEREVSRNKPLKNVKFTAEEDEFLSKGIAKHGLKNWTSILKDNNFKFHSSRTRDSLRVRVDSATFKKKYKIAS